MNKEEYVDKFISRAKQDIKICENEHELQIYIAGLLENIDYWQNEYDYMKKYRDNLQQENKLLKYNWNKLREWIVYHKHNENTKEHYLVVDYGTLLGKMQELESSESNE